MDTVDLLIEHARDMRLVRELGVVNEDFLDDIGPSEKERAIPDSVNDFQFNLSVFFLLKIWNDVDTLKYADKVPFVRLMSKLEQIMETVSFADEFEFEVTMYNNRMLMKRIYDGKMPDGILGDDLFVDIHDADGERSFGNMLKRQIQERDRANQPDMMDVKNIDNLVSFAITIHFRPVVNQPAFRRILADFRKIDTVVRALNMYILTAAGIRQFKMSVQELTRKSEEIFDSNSQRVGEDDILKIRHMKRFVRYVWGELGESWDDKDDMVFGDLTIGDRIQPWMREVMRRMKKDTLYDWRISGYLNRDIEGGDGHNIIVITVDNVKNQRLNKTSVLSNHISKVFRNMDDYHRMNMNKTLKYFTDVFIMFTNKKQLPVSKDEQTRDYSWGYQVTDRLEMSFCVVDDEFRQFQNSFCAFAGPDENIHRIRKSEIESAWHSNTWNGISDLFDK